MHEQLSLLDDSAYSEQIFIEKFDNGELDNETEEDINSLSSLDLSAMAITGTDWTTETIITQIQKQNIILNPDFQRRDAWTPKTKSRFIESLFLGLPIPQIILAEQKTKKGKFLVIDGKQRLLSLQQFVLGKEKDRLELTGLDVKKHLNRMTYQDMMSSTYREDIDAFNNQPIRTVVIKNWPSVEVLYLLFLRLNTGSVKLSPQELRQALYPGDFIKFANDASAVNEELKAMLKLKKPDFRMRDVEVFIRYYAFKHFADLYSGSMQSFLDQTCKMLNQEWLRDKYQIEAENEELSKAISLTFSIFGDSAAFRKYKGDKYEEKVNRAVIDIMLYYFSDPTIRAATLGHEHKIKQEFQRLCATNPEFLASFEMTTKSISSVNCRFSVWAQSLSAVLSLDVASAPIALR